MLVLIGCIKKSQTITGGSVKKLKSTVTPSESQASAISMNHEVPRSFLAAHSTDSSLKSHNARTNFSQYVDVLHSLSFHGKRRENKEGVRLKL
jgi:hypothetical protein